MFYKVFSSVSYCSKEHVHSATNFLVCAVKRLKANVEKKKKKAYDFIPEKKWSDLIFLVTRLLLSYMCRISLFYGVFAFNLFLCDLTFAHK